ncbi:MAG: alcohol dehydrogenase catalytic domain-containing protein [Polyangiaceae bacterium]
MPGDGWVTLAPRRTGLCGSDLGTIFFKQSPSLSVFASMPCVLGHEILADVVEVGAGMRGKVKEGDRVVVDPVLSCEVLVVQLSPVTAARSASTAPASITATDKAPSLVFQPGGFAERMVAHGSQIFKVASSDDDDRGVLAEPAAVRSCRSRAPSSRQRTHPRDRWWSDRVFDGVGDPRAVPDL